jgi:hypothetical protein
MSSDAKVSDVAARLRQQVPVSRASFMRAFDWYHATYIKPGRFAPILHVMILAGSIGYAIEYPHIKHEIMHEREEAKKV